MNRLSSFAVLRHRALSEDHNGPRLFAVVLGASHRSFASDEPSAHELILEPTITASSAAARVAALIAEQLLRTATVESSGTEPSLAARVAQPLVDALELEGSEALGKVYGYAVVGLDTGGGRRSRSLPEGGGGGGGGDAQEPELT